MNIFQNILADIKKKIDAKHVNSEVVARIVGEKIGYKITPEMIIQKEGHIKINIPPTVRMQLMIKRQDIILALNKEGFKISSIS